MSGRSKIVYYYVYVYIQKYLKRNKSINDKKFLSRLQIQIIFKRKSLLMKNNILYDCV